MKDIQKGFPLGMKINDDDLVNGLTLDILIDITKTYHNNQYVIGRDTLYCAKSHYHIHFYSAKETSKDAMKTFRSEKIKKLYPHISKSFRFYTGQDLEGVDPGLWIAYCIKETLVKVSDLTITDEIKIQAGSQLQIKQLKNVHSQKKAIEKKEKDDFKQQMLDYVRQNYTDYVKDKYKDTQLFSPDKFEMKPVRTLVIRFLKDNEKYGSLKKHFIEQYVLQFMCVYGGWDEDDLEKFIFKN